MKSPFVICGASGNVGSRIAEWLLAAGEPGGKDPPHPGTASR